jgi:hypothetical protein
MRTESAYIQGMDRLNLTRVALASTILTLAMPLASYASAPGPTTPRTVVPSDTLTKLDKSKSEHAGSAPRKKLKARQAAPPTAHPQFVPDQPWETEFYVENDMSTSSGASPMRFALASFSPRR